jgi:hypothetical protein
MSNLTTPIKPPMENDPKMYPEDPFDDFTQDEDESYTPPELVGKDSDEKLRIDNNKSQRNLFAKNPLSNEDPIEIKQNLKSIIQEYGREQDKNIRYKALVVSRILQNVRLLAGNEQFSNPETLLKYKDTLIENYPEVFVHDEFKRLIEDVFNFYSNPDNLGTGENVREGIFDISEYKIGGGTKYRRTKRTKGRRNNKRKKTRKHRR